MEDPGCTAARLRTGCPALGFGRQMMYCSSRHLPVTWSSLLSTFQYEASSDYLVRASCFIYLFLMRLTRHIKPLCFNHIAVSPITSNLSGRATFALTGAVNLMSSVLECVQYRRERQSDVSVNTCKIESRQRNWFSFLSLFHFVCFCWYTPSMWSSSIKLLAAVYSFFFCHSWAVKLLGTVFTCLHGSSRSCLTAGVPPG